MEDQTDIKSAIQGFFEKVTTTAKESLVSYFLGTKVGQELEAEAESQVIQQKTKKYLPYILLGIGIIILFPFFKRMLR